MDAYEHIPPHMAEPMRKGVEISQGLAPKAISHAPTSLRPLAFTPTKAGLAQLKDSDLLQHVLNNSSPPWHMAPPLDPLTLPVCLETWGGGRREWGALNAPCRRADFGY